MRLDTYLVHTGLGSKKEMKLAIKKGLVSINGKIVSLPNAKVVEMEDVVCYQDKKVDYQPYYYYLFHKLKGYVCTKDSREKNIYELLPRELCNQGVFSVGRLDKDTTGLLLLTTDGKWDHQLRQPRKEKRKTYYLTYKGKLSSNAEKLVSEGIFLGDFTTLPGKLEILSDFEARLTIVEGKFHQVKRMITALGGEVLTLHREQIGTLYLDEKILPGAYRSLTEEEIHLLGE